MTNRYSQIERAKQLLAIDESNERYYTFLFLALRLTGCKMKEAVKIIQAESRTGSFEINYHHLYRDPSTLSGLIQESGRRFVIMDENSAEKMEETNNSPKSILSHLIWIETITRAPRNDTDFSREIRKVRAEIVNPAGG